jgi:hypothetical protein
MCYVSQLMTTQQEKCLSLEWPLVAQQEKWTRRRYTQACFSPRFGLELSLVPFKPVSVSHQSVTKGNSRPKHGTSPVSTCTHTQGSSRPNQPQHNKATSKDIREYKGQAQPMCRAPQARHEETNSAAEDVELGIQSLWAAIRSGLAYITTK